MFVEKITTNNSAITSGPTTHIIITSAPGTAQGLVLAEKHNQIIPNKVSTIHTVSGLMNLEILRMS